MVARIETHPEIGARVADHQDTRRVLVTGFPYQVVYLVRPTEAIVVAVAPDTAPRILAASRVKDRPQRSRTAPARYAWQARFEQIRVGPRPGS